MLIARYLLQTPGSSLSIADMKARLRAFPPMEPSPVLTKSLTSGS